MPVHRHPIANSKDPGPLSSVPLDRSLIERLKASYALVREQDLKLAEIFYAKLFTAAPQLRPMFRSEPQVQTAKLIASLDAIVQNLVDPKANAAMLAALGKRHAGYGAKPEHYDLVIELLVDSMRELLGPRAQEQSLREWWMALRLVSDQMLAAGRGGTSSDDAPAPHGQGGAEPTLPRTR